MGSARISPIDHRDQHGHGAVHLARAYGSKRDMALIAESSARTQVSPRFAQCRSVGVCPTALRVGGVASPVVAVLGHPKADNEADATLEGRELEPGLGLVGDRGLGGSAAHRKKGQNRGEASGAHRMPPVAEAVIITLVMKWYRLFWLSS